MATKEAKDKTTTKKNQWPVEIPDNIRFERDGESITGKLHENWYVGAKKAVLTLEPLGEKPTKERYNELFRRLAIQVDRKFNLTKLTLLQNGEEICCEEDDASSTGIAKSKARLNLVQKIHATFSKLDTANGNEGTETLFSTLQKKIEEVSKGNNVILTEKEANGKNFITAIEGSSYSIDTPSGEKYILFQLCQLLTGLNQMNLGHYDIVLEFTPAPSTETSPTGILNEDALTSQVAQDIKTLLSQKHYQIILTGAPGTGKSYISKQIVYDYMHKDEEEGTNRLYNHYKKLTEEDDFQKTFHRFIQKLLVETSFYPMMDSEESSMELLYSADLKTLQEKNPNEGDLLQEIYGTEDKEKPLADLFWKDVASLRGRYKFVQFHPSYDYSDFVDGIRPVPQDNGPIDFRRVDGSFMSFCRYVAWRNQEWGEEIKYFFLIDEINRADLSKVLGELMFCLEKDKRGQAGRVNTQYQNLSTYFPHKKKEDEADFYYTCFKDGFYIPKNVVVIGTMNDIDRSVESMDFALRRRFTWKEVEVTDTLLSEAFKNGKMFAKYIKNTTVEERTLGKGDKQAKGQELTQEQQESRRNALRKLDNSIRTKIEESLIAGLVAQLVKFNEEGLGEKAGLGQEYYIAQGYFADFTHLSQKKQEVQWNVVDKDGKDTLVMRSVRGVVKTDLVSAPLDLNKLSQFSFSQDQTELLEKQASRITKELMAWAWENRIQGLLREYLRGSSQPEKTLEDLEKIWKTAAKPQGSDHTVTAEPQEGNP